jgi:hypothetical protein
MSSYATLTGSDTDDMFRELRSAAREELIENEIKNEMEEVNDEIEGERTGSSRIDSPVRTASREGSETVFVIDGSHQGSRIHGTTAFLQATVSLNPMVSTSNAPYRAPNKKRYVKRARPE